MKKNPRIWLLFSGVMLLLLILTCIVSAQADSTSESKKVPTVDTRALPSEIPSREDYIPENPRGTLGLGYYFNLLVSLIIVVALIFAVSYLFRFLFARLPSYAGREDFKVLSSLRMSPQATLYVVRFADEIYVLAVTPQNISVVSRINDPDAVKDIIETMSETAEMTNPHAFSTILGKRIENRIVTGAKNEKERRMKEQDVFEQTRKRLEKYDKSQEEGKGR
jgi:flagellar biogenesis protein FliO